jgi:endonuclease-8
VRLRLQTRRAYADLRGPAVCELIGRAERDAVLSRLGPDPLRDDADPDAAWHRITRSEAPIAVLLLRQEVLAGVGNVYRAEVLFRHGVDPHLPGRHLTRGQWQAIWADLVELMQQGVGSGRIDTVRPEHTPEAMGRLPRIDDHGGRSTSTAARDRPVTSVTPRSAPRCSPRVISSGARRARLLRGLPRR